MEQEGGGLEALVSTAFEHWLVGFRSPNVNPNPPPPPSPAANFKSEPSISMDHIVKLRKSALADLEAEQLKLKMAREAHRKRASVVIKVLL